MREIKFRAWDKKYKEMIIDIHIAPEYGWLVLSDNDALAERERPKEGQIILMQYTGLKDKNGKEIYEGDIVSFKRISEYDSCNEWTAGFGIVKFGKYEIEFDEYNTEAYGFYVEGYDEYKRRDDGSLDCYNNFKSILEITEYKVIGNIYENPELLK